MNLSQIKERFPTLQNNPHLVYLDSGASSLTPQAVIDAMDEYYVKYRSNVHRGLYEISIKATEAYEGARVEIAKFINASPEEIIFTTGTTPGLNALAYTLTPRLTHRDNIVLTRMEHHANLVPWQQMAKHYGFEIRFIGLQTTDHGLQPNTIDRSPLTVDRSLSPYTLDLKEARALIDGNTKIVSLVHASNVLGTVNPIEEIIKITRAQAPRAYTIIDAAQSIVHLPTDVKDLDCDFLAFSGHKMYGPTGVGVLYGKKVMLEEHLEPFFFGGDMVADVTYTDAVWNDLPYKFEAGTPNISGAVGLSAAVKFIQEIGWDEIIQHEQSLTNKLINQLTDLGVNIVGPTRDPLPTSPSAEGERPVLPSFAKEGAGGKVSRIGVISFTLPGVHPHDIGEIVNREGVAIRVGHHCAIPLHKMLGLTGTARASLGVYNTEEDINKLIQGIKKVIKIFK